MRATEYPVPAGQRKASSGCKRPIRTSTGEDSAGAGAETPAAGPSAADWDSKGGVCLSPEGSSAECGWHHEV